MKALTNSCTPLYAAVAAKASRVIALLLQREDVQSFIDIPDSEGITPLMVACAAHDATYCSVLLAAGANPKARSNNGKTPLHHVYV